jgi:addiction module HigA family antidote
MTRPAIHPGEILEEELEFRSISPTEAARAVGVPANRISQILHGKRAITADTALRLGYWLGTGPELWLNLQRQYELRVTESELGDEIRRTIVPLSVDPALGATRSD